MLDAYFVVAQGSGNIIRITRRDKKPDDSATIHHVPATDSQLERHATLLAWGQDLISVTDASRGEASRLSS